jgi:hypothetical protein
MIEIGGWTARHKSRRMGYNPGTGWAGAFEWPASSLKGVDADENR